ncbi:MAG: hypothetical protein CBD77_01750 [bacterium TMED217]|nr:MAG: hypothetical protein CBD77_01750 [bacterium TMED217]|tara:strand:+ start:8788 stop:9546 length:759 start_codon:yes stop_codon:yes gene_type:complete
MSNFDIMSVCNNQFVIKSLVAPLYSEPTFTSSKISEAVFGEIVNVNDVNGSWVNIEQDDGYHSWIKDFYGSFEKKNAICEYIVVDKYFLPFGSRLQKTNGKYKTVIGDDYTYNIEPIKIGEIVNIDDLLIHARNLIGSPYRWGGKTSFGFDCSGFVQSLYLLTGLLLPRDCWQQSEFLEGSLVSGRNSKPGDLHFFGKDSKISHVGISTGGLNLIHCQGWVKEESFENINSGNENLVDMYMHSCSVELNSKR